MAGEKGVKEKGKKVAEKTLKEKRAAKDAKKKEKNSNSSLWFKRSCSFEQLLF